MKSHRLAAVAAALLLATTACTQKTITPIFNTLAIDTLLGTAPNACRVEYRFVRIANADLSPILQAIETENIGYFFGLEEFSGDAEQAANRAIAELAAELLLPGGFSEGEVSVEAEAFVQDTLLTYTISSYSFTGGAHGIYGVCNHNYSLRTGAELALADLFDEQARQKLDTLVRLSICKQYDAHNDEELSALGFFPESIAAPENFRLTDQGMTFFFNPYEIGCYALGGVETTVLREDLMRLNPALGPKTRKE